MIDEIGDLAFVATIERCQTPRLLEKYEKLVGPAPAGADRAISPSAASVRAAVAVFLIFDMVVSFRGFSCSMTVFLIFDMVVSFRVRISNGRTHIRIAAPESSGSVAGRENPARQTHRRGRASDRPACTGVPG